MNKLNEFSSEKTKFRRSLFGTRKNIFTICIASVDNPMGFKIPEETNRMRRKEFEEILRSHRLKYYKIDGMYDNHEVSYVIANINLSMCEHLFGSDNFNQESFIFGKVIDYSSIVFTYYQQNRQNQFIAQDSSEVIKSRKDAENYFSEYLGFKFQIPFSIFESIISNISNDLEKDYGWNSEYKKDLEYIALTENTTLGHLYRYSCSNLLTEQQEKKRLENLERFYSI